ncbi:ABC transporter permease [Chitinivibrio alkaliphilus]|uniref:ABC-type transport system involved in lipoprotein release, permease component n=1 Tax=Chitinivibrio alkaliphilus ACht1 TaxID=1313304 RepID=U7D9N6_9BACT|nr:FtsX-like permease family protein [Chitinivibrio alkaliphilus]ERP38737.1 ABC-type transport system involved in lipoprotein release, permease component [Chitinivibrio alkaliphilus ACht1]
MVLLKIAFRNIFRQKRRSALTLLTMTAGFFMASLAIAFNVGSYNVIIRELTRNETGHVKIAHSTYRSTPDMYYTIDNYRDVLGTMEDREDVAFATAELFGSGLAATDTRSLPVSVRAVDPRRHDEVFSYGGRVTEGEYMRSQKAEVLLGKHLARRLRVAPGDTLYLFSQTAYGRVAEDIFSVRGIVSPDQQRISESLLLMPLDIAQEYYELWDRVHEISLVGTHENARNLAAEVQKSLSDPYIAEPWQEFNRSLYEAMQADQKGGIVGVTVILIIVGFGILNTVLMAVLERQREYGVLKAVGTTPGQVFGLIVAEMMILAILSILVALPLSWSGSYYFATEGIPLSDPFTFGGVVWSHIYADIIPLSFTLPAVVVGVVTLFVSLFPAMKAARTNPADTMRID